MTWNIKFLPKSVHRPSVALREIRKPYDLRIEYDSCNFRSRHLSPGQCARRFSCEVPVIFLADFEENLNALTDLKILQYRIQTKIRRPVLVLLPADMYELR